MTRLQLTYICRGPRRSQDEILSRVAEMHARKASRTGDFLTSEEVAEAKRRLKFRGCGTILNDEMDRIAEPDRLLLFPCPSCRTVHVIERTT